MNSESPIDGELTAAEELAQVGETILADPNLKKLFLATHQSLKKLLLISDAVYQRVAALVGAELLHRALLEEARQSESTITAVREHITKVNSEKPQ
jgi:hypothetical protein